MDIKALAAMLEQAEDPGDKYTGPKASPGSALPPDPATLEAAKVEQSAVARALARKRGQLVGNEPGRGGGGASSSATTSTSSTAKSASLEAKNSKDIWDVDEVPSSAAELLTNEHMVTSSTSSSSSTTASSSSGGGGRLRPKFDILFKQKIGTEEVFLGVSGTTPL